MDAAHRFVELQAPADLAYLEQNARRTARLKLDLNFPPSAAPDGEDALRRRVEELVEEYLSSTFVEAKKNLSINGMAFKESDEVGEEFEPFDTRLLDRIRTLEGQKDALIERVAVLRRSAPLAAAQDFKAAYSSQKQTESTTFEERKHHSSQKGTQEGTSFAEVPKRQDEFRQSYGDAVTNLGALNRGLGSTVGKLERAVCTVAYLEGR